MILFKKFFAFFRHHALKYLLLFTGILIGLVVMFFLFYFKDPDLLAEFPTSNATEIKVTLPKTFQAYGCSASFIAKSYKTFTTDAELSNIFQYYSQVGVQRGLAEKRLENPYSDSVSDRPNYFACFEGESRTRTVPTIVVAVVDKNDDFAFTTLKTLSGVVNKKTFFLILYGYTYYV